MAEAKKRRKRVKGTSGRATTTSSRYTPPVPESYRHSSKAVPIAMFLCFVLGVAVIVLNYMPNGAFLPNGQTGWNLIIGLGLILFGFGISTRYH